MGEGLLTTKQAAERLGLTIRTIVKLIKRDLLPGAQKLGRDWFIPISSIDAYEVERRPVGRPKSH